MDWGGIIAGAIGGGAQAIGNIARDQRLMENSQAMAKFQADLDVDKAQRIAELQQAVDLKKFDTSTPDSYGSKAIAFNAATATATGNAQTGVEAARLKTLGPIQTSNEVAREKELAPIRTQAKVDEIMATSDASANAQIKLAKSPDYMAALRSLKTAQESSASLAQAALARLQVSKLQGDQALLDELAKARASGDEDAVQAVQQKITDRAYTGKDTAKAYGAYQSAQTKLIDLETKLNDPTKMLEPAAVASLKQEIQEARLVQQQALKEMGIKVPKAADAGIDLSKFNRGASTAPTATGAPAATTAPAATKGPAATATPAAAPAKQVNPPGLIQGLYPGQEQKDLMDLNDAKRRLQVAQDQLRLAVKTQNVNDVKPYAANVARVQAEVNQIESKYTPGYLDSIRTSK